MCGIVGFLDKTGNNRVPVGETLLQMLKALGRRGPDSAGVAIYGNQRNGSLVLRVKLGERGTFEERAKYVIEQVRSQGTLEEATTTAEYLRLVMDYRGDLQELERLIASVNHEIEVVSIGHRLEIVKQVGSPQNLDATYTVGQFRGTHGIGHVRLSTESRVDLSHSQPFWAHGYPDLAVVHNGHITNYHKLRRRYEQRGVRFYTENDSEVIGVYLAEHLARGMSFEEALRASVVELDGSFSYIAATADEIGFAKDAFALKPLLFAETATFVAIATEEIAMRVALPGTYHAREAQAREVRVWRVLQATGAVVAAQAAEARA